MAKKKLHIKGSRTTSTLSPKVFTSSSNERENSSGGTDKQIEKSKPKK